MTCSEKEGGRGLRPCEENEILDGVPARRKQFAEVVEVVSGLEYAHAQHPPKGNAAGVNGGLARGERRR